MPGRKPTFIDRAIIYFSLAAVILTTAAFAVFFVTGRTPAAGSRNLTPQSSAVHAAASQATTTAAANRITAGTTEAVSEAPAETERLRDKTSIIPDGPSFAEISPDGKVDYSRIRYASIVPECGPAPDGYFEDALFIGNSIQQIQRQIGSIRADYITTGDHNVFRYFEWELAMPDGQKMTTAAYLASHAYGKIYLTFGINEVSYDDQEQVWRGFRAMLADVQQKQPQAAIYLVGLLPVYPPLMNETARRLITPEKILEFNHKLAILAEDEGVYMLNPAEALQDENGFLKAEWSKDGVHFGSEATRIWDDYTRTHAVSP